MSRDVRRRSLDALKTFNEAEDMRIGDVPPREIRMMVAPAAENAGESPGSSELRKLGQGVRSQVFPSIAARG
jgi:hypothetical protein